MGASDLLTSKTGSHLFGHEAKKLFTWQAFALKGICHQLVSALEQGQNKARAMRQLCGENVCRTHEQLHALVAYRREAA